MQIKYKKYLLYMVLLSLFLPEGMAILGNVDVITNAVIFDTSFFHIGIKMLYWFRNGFGIVYTAKYFIEKLYNIEQRKAISVFSSLDYLALYFVWIICVSKKNNIELYGIAIFLFCCFGNTAFIYDQIRKNQYAVIKQLKNILNCMLIINLVLILAYPRGLATGTDYLSTPYHFWGTKNQVTPLLVFSSMVFFLYYEYEMKCRKLIVEQVLVMVNTLLLGSSTGMVCVLVNILLYLVLMRHKHKNDSIKGKILSWVITTVAFITMGMVFFNIQRLFSFLIVDILGKDVTLSGRTAIWGKALEAIERYPIGGHGYGYKADRDFYAHNLYLELLVTSGIVGFLLYSIFMVKSIVQAMKTRAHLTNIVICCIVSLAFCNISEAFIYNFPQLIAFCMLNTVDNNACINIPVIRRICELKFEEPCGNLKPDTSR